LYVEDARLIIRKAVHDDAPLIIQSHIRSIREVCLLDYTPEQIAAWSGRDFKVSRWCESIDRDQVWVISNEQREIFGFGHLMFPVDGEGYVAGLYFVPEAKGLGFGQQMMGLILAEARKRQLKLIKLDGTKTALKFYLAAGFVAGESACVVMADQQIDCIKMQMHL
jgi:ribosomal protein S18 acetylase RimI-like enzyme